MKLPDEIRELFEDNPSIDHVRATGSDSLKLYGKSENLANVGVEFTRSVGQDAFNYGYVITGVREHSDHVEVWFDNMEERIKERSIAEQAADILYSSENDTTLEPNDSDDPKEQYVDVFPKPHESATMDWSIRPGKMEELHDAGIRVRAINCGTSHTRYTDAEYRVWFEPIPDSQEENES